MLQLHSEPLRYPTQPGGVCGYAPARRPIITTIPVALIGFGNVGQALATIFRDHGDRLERDYGVRFSITGVADITGAVVSSRPLSIDRLLEVMRASGGVAHYPKLGVPGVSGAEMIRRTGARILVEASSLMEGSLRLSDVEREGVTGLTVEDVRAARDRGEALKLVGTAQWVEGKLRATVRPTHLPAGHPLASVDGTEKGVTFHSDLLGTITVVGGASGRIPAAASILRDLLNLVREAGLVRQAGRVS